MNENLEPVENKKPGKGQVIASTILMSISALSLFFELILGAGLMDALHPDDAGEALVLIFIIALFALPLIFMVLSSILSIIGACLAGHAIKVRDDNKGYPVFLLIANLVIIVVSILFILILFNSGHSSSTTTTTTTVANSLLLFFR